MLSWGHAVEFMLLNSEGRTKFGRLDRCNIIKVIKDMARVGDGVGEGGGFSFRASGCGCGEVRQGVVRLSAFSYVYSSS